MSCRKALLLITLFCATSLVAQNVYDVYPERVPTSDRSAVRSQTADVVRSQKSDGEKAKGQNGEKAKKSKFLTGFTGGMMLHAGYAFAKSPDELFHNGSLQESNLRQDGITLGLGGALRLHLINHIHLGAEGGMSTMPLAHSSSIRTGWGGALCDYYGEVGKVQLFIGGTIGGGITKRLYVPSSATEVQATDAVVYNASYTETPFFLLDPYVGLEAALSQRTVLLIKIDYMLPFGKGDSGITTDAIRWSNFLSPSGPRLYVGIMFGRHDKR